MIGLSPYAPGTLEEFVAFLQREAPESDRELAIAALNAATGWFRARTGRRLQARTYRTQAALSCTATVDDATLAGSGFTAGARVDDLVVGTSLFPSRVVSIASNTALELHAAPHTSGAFTAAFGSAPLRLDGDGTSTIWIPERPVIAIYSVALDNGDGTTSALDLTDARLDPESGEYVLAYDYTTPGSLNVLISCRCGYTRPSGTEAGEPDEYAILLWAHHRLAQAMFTDWVRGSGRMTRQSIGQSASEFTTYKAPDDVEDVAERFKRLW